jgi:SpoIID/LytB domain protein
MLKEEPKIMVGILQARRQIAGELLGDFYLAGVGPVTGRFNAVFKKDAIHLAFESGQKALSAEGLHLLATGRGTFILFDVAIGIDFHWERMEPQTFKGDLTLTPGGEGNITAVNAVDLEDYLASVIASEMSAGAPVEFLKAHAVASRSWLAAMLRQKKETPQQGQSGEAISQENSERIRWYDREDHGGFDVCADDHCQRYQGINRLQCGNAQEACEATRGLFLVYDGRICDARYHKCCGGLTDRFETAWADIAVPYLSSVSDAATSHGPVETEADAQRWISGSPEAYCNTKDDAVIRDILPSYDQETLDFFRWQIYFTRDELEEILRSKTGMNFGTLQNITPLERGPSGRIVRLRIEGSEETLIIGKELEIRRCLSPSHLYSSAFVVRIERNGSEAPVRFTFNGAGWGHGIGLCQIGAAVMAQKGFTAEDILRHYFNGAQLKKLY